MVVNGTLMIKDRKGMIVNLTLEEIYKKYKTLQTLSMNHHGHEKYSFSLIEKITCKHPEVLQEKFSTEAYEVKTVNSLGQIRSLICSGDTHVFTKGEKWSGFISLDKLKKNAVLIDDEDRVNRITSLRKITNSEPKYDVQIMYTGNYFYNGLLIR